MSKTDQELYQLADDFQKQTGIRVFRASLGDENGRVDLPGQTGFVYIRYYTATGLSQPYIVAWRAGSMTKTPGTGVIVEYDYDKNLAIKRADYPAMLAQGTNPTINNPADPNNSYYVQQMRLVTFTSHPVSSTANSMLVAVQSGTVLDLDADTLTLFAGEQVDLTSYIPGGAGEWCLACLFWKTDNTIEVIASTPKTSMTDLGIDDVNECIAARTAGSLPIWAWQLYNGQTGIAAGAPANGGDDFLDLRPLFFMLQSGGSGSSIAVTDGTTTVDPTTEIDFDPAYFDVTSPGGGVAGVTIPDQNANKVFAGPATGADAAPAFRALVDDDIPAALTLVGGSINNTPIGATTANTGIFSALSLLISTFKGIFTHANTADRTYTFQDRNTGVAATEDSAWFLPVRCSANSNQSVSSAPATIDGVSVSSGDRVLLTGQTTGSENGIWESNGAGVPMTRPADYPSGSTLIAHAGMFVRVDSGTQRGTLNYRLSTSAPITIDTTATTWGSVSSYGMSTLNITGAGNARNSITTSATAARTNTMPDSAGAIVVDAATQTLSNKNLEDSTVTFADNADLTKQFRFEVSGVAASTTRVATVADEDFRLGQMTAASFGSGGLQGLAPAGAAKDNTKLLSGAATYIRAALTLFSLGADVTVASTGAETTITGSGLGSLTIPANALNEIGREFEIRAVGYASRSTGNTTVKVKVGGTTIFTFGASAIVWAGTRFEVYAKFTTKATGASGSIKGQGYFDNFTTATTFVRNTFVDTTGTTLDLTGTLAVDVTWQWSVSGSAQTVTCTNLDIIQVAA